MGLQGTIDVAQTVAFGAAPSRPARQGQRLRLAARPGRRHKGHPLKAAHRDWNVLHAEDEHSDRQGP